MGRKPSENAYTKPSDYLDSFGHGYAYNRSSRLYEPNPAEHQEDGDSGTTGKTKKTPLFVDIRRDWLILLLSVLTVLGLGLTVMYTRRQWLEANRGADAAQASAQYALNTLYEIKNQTTLLRQQTAGTFAASVTTESPRPTPFSNDPELTRQQGLYLYFANVGRVNASSFRATATLARESLPNYRALSKPQKRSIEANQIRPFTQMPPGIPGFYTEDVYMHFDMGEFTAQDIELLRQMKEVVEVRGFSEYGDGFGNTVRQPFCFLYVVPIRHVFVSSGAVTEGGEGRWGLCQEMRHYISQTQRW